MDCLNMIVGFCGGMADIFQVLPYLK